MWLAPLATIFLGPKLRPRPAPNEAPATIPFTITELVCGQPARNDVRGADGRPGTGASEFLGRASDNAAVAANVAAGSWVHLEADRQLGGAHAASPVAGSSKPSQLPMGGQDQDK